VVKYKITWQKSNVIFDGLAKTHFFLFFMEMMRDYL